MGRQTALGALVALVVLSAAPQRAALDVPAIDRAVRMQVDSGFSGVVLIARNDSVLLHRAYYPRDKRLMRDDAFWIASMTKGFTAAAILRLQKDGRLSVHDSIARFFPNAPRDKRGVTVQQLLIHTSGLGGDYSGGGITDRSEAVRAILAPALRSPPGESYRYGDDDYELLAAIIEIASGTSWETYVREHVLHPLHLDGIGFACGAQVDRAVLRSVICDWGHKGANGMFATARELLTWSRVLTTSTSDSAIVRPQIFVRREPQFDVSYSYGARVYTLDDRIVEVMHSGAGDDDHTGIVRSLRSGLTVVVLSNAGRHAGTTWSSFIANRILPRALGSR